ncbi:hypothetical protein Tco_0249062, partial [Tanacetum coccineum]
QDKVFDVSSFSANVIDFEYSNGKQTPLSGCDPDQKDLWEYEKGFSRGTKTFIACYVTFPSTSSPPVQSPPPIHASIPTPTPTPTPTPIPKTEPAPFEHTFKEPSPVHQHFSPPQE